MSANVKRYMWGQPLSAVRPGNARKFAVQVAIATTLVAASCIFTSAQGNPAKTTEDLPPAPMQAKATTACTECHEARIILQQRLSKAAWTKEVDKMIKWGAVVDASDHDPLIDYLSTNFGVDQPSYQAPRTTANKKGLSN
jgi:hypothetical protein